MRRELSNSSLVTTRTIISTIGGKHHDGGDDDDDDDDDDDATTASGSPCNEALGMSIGRCCRGTNNKFRARLRRYLSSIGGENINASPCDILLLDEYGRCNYQTKDGKFNIRIFQDAKKLSISTCVYLCSSEVASLSVMRRALELNHSSRGDRHGFTLGIDPGLPDGSPSMPMTLGVTRSMSHMKRSDVLFTLNNFIEIANNIRSKLEEADDGRLGMAPTPFFRLRAPTHDQLMPTNVPPGLSQERATLSNVQKTKTKTATRNRRNSIARTIKSDSFNNKKKFEKTSTASSSQASTLDDDTDSRKIKQELQRKWRQARRKSVVRAASQLSLQGHPRCFLSPDLPPPQIPWGAGMDNTPVISNKKCIRRVATSRISFPHIPPMDTCRENAEDDENARSCGGSTSSSHLSICATSETLTTFSTQNEVYQDDESTISELVWV